MQKYKYKINAATFIGNTIDISTQPYREPKPNLTHWTRVIIKEDNKIKYYYGYPLNYTLQVTPL